MRPPGDAIILGRHSNLDAFLSSIYYIMVYFKFDSVYSSAPINGSPFERKVVRKRLRNRCAVYYVWWSLPKSHGSSPTTIVLNVLCLDFMGAIRVRAIAAGATNFACRENLILHMGMGIAEVYFDI
jgi:hypothetical protein